MRLDLKVSAGSLLTSHKLELQTMDSAVPAPGKVRFVLDGQAVEADWAEVTPHGYSIIFGGRSYDVAISAPPEAQAGGRGPEPRLSASLPPGHPAAYLVTVNGHTHLVEVRDLRRWVRAHSTTGGAGPQEILAPMPGRIVKVLVAERQQVAAGDGLLVIEAMKMQNEIRAPRPGRVEKVYVDEGSGVETGFKLVRLG